MSDVRGGDETTKVNVVPTGNGKHQHNSISNATCTVRSRLRRHWASVRSRMSMDAVDSWPANSGRRRVSFWPREDGTSVSQLVSLSRKRLYLPCGGGVTPAEAPLLAVDVVLSNLRRFTAGMSECPYRRTRRDKSPVRKTTREATSTPSIPERYAQTTAAPFWCLVSCDLSLLRSE